jgi:heat shock protein 4
MSVVGIDFGNLNTVVAVARNRGIDVITNETSSRPTPSLVSFGEKQRYLGEGAKTLEISNFQNTVCSLKRLLGRNFNDPEVQEYEAKFINAKLTQAERGEVACSVTFKNEPAVYTFTQLCAMFLAKVKNFTGAELGIPCVDCVISCPNWFTDSERRALLDAAHVAGLNPLRIMNDTTAAALGYGITKTDLPDPAEGGKPRVVCFVDVGHASTQVTVASFVKGKLTVHGTSTDRNLGGRDFDEAITQHFVKEFSSKYKMDIASNPKAIHRLRTGAEKVKKLLSANSTAPFNVECLMNDKDVSALVERADFEEMAKSLFERFETPLKAALENAKMTTDDIDLVELVGGSTRIPKLKETLAKLFGGDINGQNKLSFTLNQDEAIARGCAFQCAIISPSFKVREFSVQDIHNHPVELHWDPKQLPDPKKGEKQITEMVAFASHHPVPSSKLLTFSRLLRAKELAKSGTVDFTVHAQYGNDLTIPSGTMKQIGDFVIGGVKKYPSCMVMDGDKELYSKATIKVVAKLTGNGLISLEGAYQTEEVEVTGEEASESKEADQKGDEKAKGKSKTVIRKHPLTITSRTAAAPPDLLNSWLALEGDMAASDRLVIDTAEKKNTLEEYVYNTRSKLHDEWAEYVLEAERESFSAELNNMEDWLYGDGEDVAKSVYIEKLNELKLKGGPIAVRFQEYSEFPTIEREFRQFINNSILDLQAEVHHINPGRSLCPYLF